MASDRMQGAVVAKLLGAGGGLGKRRRLDF